MAVMSIQERELVEKHLYLVRGTVLGTVSVNETVQGLGYDDLYQIGCEALCHAAQKYREDGGAAFPTFAGIVIKNRLISHCRKITKVQKPLPTRITMRCQMQILFSSLVKQGNAAPAPQEKVSRHWRSNAGDIPVWRLPPATAHRQTMWLHGFQKQQECCGKKN